MGLGKARTGLAGSGALRDIDIKILGIVPKKNVFKMRLRCSSV